MLSINEEQKWTENALLTSTQNLIKEVDSILYRAKKLGRNRVEISFL